MARGGGGIGAFLMAGMATGVGNALIEDARQKRAEALKKLELDRATAEKEKDRQFQLERDDRNFGREKELRTIDQGFRSGEAEKERGWRSGESETERRARAEEAEKERGFRGGEAEKERSTRGTYGETPDGKTQFIQGDRARPVLGEDGKPVGAVDRSKAAERGMSDTEKRLRFTEGYKAGRPSSDIDQHDWRKSVSTWKALGIPPSDPRVIEFVHDDLRAQAAKKGLRGDANDAFVREEMDRLGVPWDGRPQTLKTRGDTAPTRLESGSSSVERAPTTKDRMDSAFGGFGKGDAKPPAPAGGEMKAQHDAARAKAAAAIAAGAPREAVIERLRKAGVDPGDL